MKERTAVWLLFDNRWAWYGCPQKQKPHERLARGVRIKKPRNWRSEMIFNPHHRGAGARTVHGSRIAEFVMPIFIRHARPEGVFLHPGEHTHIGHEFGVEMELRGC